MVKKLVLIVALGITLSANINTKVQNLLGVETYNTHQNLINFIFSQKSAYYTNGQLNYTLVTQKLQDNNLLKLNFPSTTYINVNFILKGEEKKALFILKDILKSLGHYYYFTQEANHNENDLFWSIKLKTDVAINPLRLSQSLDKANSKILNIIKEGSSNYTYVIDFTNSELAKVEDLKFNSQITLKKPFRPYMINVANATSINIDSHIGNRWHPNITFYDNSMNILEVVKEDSFKKSFKVDVPVDTSYIKIDDLYSLSNLKRGISITKE
ncbi:hypothetical protein ACH5BF_03210 [Arcobacter sp. YIC-464]|uniref:hypothetical protein n=1 Tax=Arcobacter sp. YIC-464 TaxID=3376631 RepID=UPI003C21D739